MGHMQINMGFFINFSHLVVALGKVVDENSNVEPKVHTKELFGNYPTQFNRLCCNYSCEITELDIVRDKTDKILSSVKEATPYFLLLLMHLDEHLHL